jgi:23S rRNA U2552 (ribose-2'-O)-methylase RlmE/FtsJ
LARVSYSEYAQTEAGGWLQVVKKRVGTAKVDLKSVEPVADAIILKGDIQDRTTVAEIFKNLNDRVDVVLYDLAPDVKRSRDVFTQNFSLTLSGLAITRKVLTRSGRAILKVYEGIC